MAQTKSGGSTKNGRDSRAKRLGVKINHGQVVEPGQIILRQRGSHYIEGIGVKRGGDDTLYAGKAGVVSFKDRKKTRFDGRTRNLKEVSVL
ncbi:MAG: 50S ribosomal protein L27 [Candidatus Harrisonbacteria bacterium]|nr:50S ribosomal protein L27 [Candidatus Harrisonbacteria bacterium]